MGKNKVDIDIGTSSAEAHLDALIQKARALNDELKRAGSALGSDPSQANAANFFAVAQRLDAVNSAQSTIQGSTTIGGSTQVGAFAPKSQFKNVTLADPGAAMSALQNAGLSNSAMLAAAPYLASGQIPLPSGGGAFSPSSYVAQILQSAQAGPQASPFDQRGSFSPAQLAPAINPFMGQAPTGPSSSLDPFAANQRAYSTWQMQQAQQGQTQMAQLQSRQAFGIGLGVAAAAGVSGYLDYQTERIMHGGSDTLGAARMGGAIAGGVIGGAIGLLGGTPMSVALGAGIGASIGGSATAWLFAPKAAAENAGVAMQPFLGAYGSREGSAYWRNFYLGKEQGHDITGLLPTFTQSRFERMSQTINSKLPAYLQTSVETLGETFGAVASGLFAGGVDPMGPGQGGLSGTTHSLENWGGRNWRQDLGNVKPGKSLIDDLVNLGVAGIKHDTALKYHSDDETLAETYTRRISQLFGKDAPDVAKRQSAIFATIPETGGNLADILAKFGPEDSTVWQRIHNEDLTKGLGSLSLSKVSASLRSSNRQALLGATQARGSGAAQEAAFDTELQTISSLPDGANSLEAAGLRVKRRAARNERFQQEDIVNYGIHATELQGQLDRLDALPYSPGNRMFLSAEMIQANRRQIGVIRNRRTALKQRGDLTEEQELQFTQQEQNLMTTSATLLADIVDNVPNRLPALSAGRPGGAGFKRLNTQDLVAIQMGRAGIPYRGAGAQNGAQLKAQDDFLAPVADGLDFTAHNRMSNLNQMGRGGGGSDDETKAILRDIANLLRKAVGGGGGNGSQRPGEASSQSGALNGRYVKINSWMETSGRNAN